MATEWLRRGGHIPRQAVEAVVAQWPVNRTVRRRAAAPGEVEVCSETFGFLKLNGKVRLVGDALEKITPW